MAFLDAFFGKRDPTQDWRAQPGLKLEFDLDAHALCGVKPGDPVPFLEKLGPAEDKVAARKGEYRYLSRGVAFSGADAFIDSILLIWRDEDEAGFQGYAGACLRGGKAVPLGSDWTVEQFVQTFGPPYWKDDDESESLLFYEFRNFEWQAEFSKDPGGTARLSALLVVTPPLMADAAQREAYGVDKAWPPA